MPMFLVRMDLKFPAQYPSAGEETWVAERITDLYAAEARAAKPYLDSGQMSRVFRVPGTRNHIALWDVPGVQVIHDAYTSFPMFPWMTVKIEALCTNPNDPGTPAADLPNVKMTYRDLRIILDGAKRSGENKAMEHGYELVPGVSIHDHPGTDRGRQIHFMVDGQKLCELGPVDNEGEGIGPGYVDFLAEWFGKPVRHAQWEARIKADNGLLHPGYSAALAAPRARF